MGLKPYYLLLLLSATALWGNPLFATLLYPSRVEIKQAVETLNPNKCSSTFGGVPQIYFSPNPEKSISITPEHEITAEVVIRIRSQTEQNQPTETIKLPSALAYYLRTIPGLSAIVTPGNTLYDETPHNLASDFFNYFVKNYPHIGSTLEAEREAGNGNLEVYNKTEHVTISYDDNTKREGLTNFYTEGTYFRNEYVEFFFTKIDEHPFVFIRPLGDYNEVGQAVSAVLNFFNISKNKVMFVSDSMDKGPGDITLTKSDSEYNNPINPERNASVISMNEAFAFEAFHATMDELIPKHPIFNEIISNQENRNQLVNDFQKKVTSKNKDIFPGNKDSIIKHITSSISNIIKSKQNGIRRTIEATVSKSLNTYTERMSELQKQMKTASKEEKSGLSAKIKETSNDMKKEREIVNNSEVIQAFDKDLKDLTEDVHTSAESHTLKALSYAHLKLGIGSLPEGTSVEEFLLGNYSKDTFNEDFFERVLSTVANYLKTFPPSN